MPDTETRPAPPPLEYEPPMCSICGEQTEVEDGVLHCKSCAATWDIDAYHLDGYSSWDDSAGRQCTAAIAPWAHQRDAYPHIADARYRCLLAVGHDGKHRHPEYYDGWTDAATGAIPASDEDGGDDDA